MDSFLPETTKPWGDFFQQMLGAYGQAALQQKYGVISTDPFTSVGDNGQIYRDGRVAGFVLPTNILPWLLIGGGVIVAIMLLKN